MSSRREILRGFGGLVGLGALQWMGCGGNGDGNGSGDENGTGTPGDIGTDLGADPGTDTSTVVRYDVMSSEGQAMLDAYRRAVDVMKRRPDSDPTSWIAQARIHLDWCPHGNAYFLPWHRAYIHYFERIVREAAGDPAFALPFWDWSTHPTLPPALWEGTLNDETRQIRRDQPVPPEFVGPDVIRGILDISDFQTFASAYVTPSCRPSSDGKQQRASCATGRLEGTPHNNVHVTVGGRRSPVGHMSTFWSPRDPIFWLHHCNVDRLWAEWNLRHANGDDPDWRGFEFQGNFVDPAGQPQNIRVEQLFDTQALGYRYATIPAARPETAAAPSSGTVVGHVEAAAAAQRRGQVVSVPLELTDELRRSLPRAAAPEGGARRTVRLTIGGIEQPSVAVPVRVFVGSPELPPGGTQSPHYAGTFSFFPIGEGAHEGHGTHSFLFDVGEQLAELDPSGPLHVHVESQPLGPSTEGGAAPVITPTVFRLEVVEHR